jgi:hypothetical protein
MSEDRGLPFNEADILRIIRRSRELGISDQTIAELLQVTIRQLRTFLLRHGSPEERQQTVSILRRK